ncbi:sensor histidine kinase [Marinitoga litoralis]|uniref:sensor histidine kinase n=1 Tax=Marinitoga litoralis TaxID=570855 RepID=UPI00195FB5BD|nr:HAMP domain-containing sensor histidine kinase [Marinitoga litoralis]MBM7560212.1 signal transduction histidine kinase [Marinitoga litoralis]
MKNNIRNEILILNISTTLILLILIFFITLNSFQKNILNNTLKKMTEYSQESQIYFMNVLKGYNYENIFEELERMSPFISDYLSQKYNLHIEIYDIRKKILANTNPETNYYVYQDIHYAINSMKNYILKKDNNKIILFFSSPIFFQNSVIGAIRFIYPMENEYQLINNVRNTLLLIGIISILLIIILNYILSNSIIIPIKKLKKETEIISKGNFTNRINIKSNDDINSLVNSFNIMIDKIEHYIKSLKEEKERQKVFIDNMTHEFKTPITSILGHAELLRRLKSEKDKEVSIKHIINEGNRLLKLVEELLYLSKINKNTFKFEYGEYNIEYLIDECLSILKPRLEKFNIEVYTNVQSKTLFFDYEKIKEVVLNILDNAIKHSKCTELRIYSEISGNYYSLVIEDNGIGIENTNDIFKPLFSSKGRKNNGLGLCISQEIVKNHNGEILVESEINKGSKFIIKLY